VPSIAPQRRRWALALALVLALVVALGWGTRRFQRATARHFSGLDGAEWIWAPIGKLEQTPAAFYLVRDFELGAPPERARLLVAADEEYVLTLNARVIGAGVWRAGPKRLGPGRGSTALDVYEVGSLLRPGGNRLLVEVRSGRAAGGLLLRLDGHGGGAADNAGTPLVVSDGSWRIVRSHHPGLVRGWLPLAPPGTSEPAFSWGLPPIGRWGRPVAGPPRPPLADVLGTSLQAERPVRLAPGLVGGERLEPQALFDWGREVTGYLVLELAPLEPPASQAPQAPLAPNTRRRTALLFPGAGAGPPDPFASPATPGQVPVIPVIVPPGAREWRAPRPGRLRFARVLGLPDLVGARIEPLTPEQAAVLGDGLAPLGEERAQRGVLGLEPPPLRTPVEDEVWRELERVPGVARREKL